MILSRRSFLTGLVAAPIIVRAGIIMPIKPVSVLAPGEYTVTVKDIVWTASPNGLTLAKIVMFTDEGVKVENFMRLA